MNFVLHFLVLCIKFTCIILVMQIVLAAGRGGSNEDGFSYRNMYVRATYRDMDGICGND